VISPGSTAIAFVILLLRLGQNALMLQRLRAGTLSGGLDVCPGRPQEDEKQQDGATPPLAPAGADGQSCRLDTGFPGGAALTGW
jgi:hypothetical protein